MSAKGLRGAAAIVSCATAGIPVAADRRPIHVIAEAAYKALAGAGLKTTDVDGIVGVLPEDIMGSITVAEFLGIQPKFSDNNRIGGSTFLTHTQIAAMALQAGLCDTVLVFYGSTQRSQMGKLNLSMTAPILYEHRYKPIYPGSSYALAASRHMHQYGTTKAQLAEVAVAARGWAKLNPEAFKREDLTIEEVVDAPMVSDPLGVRDCCLVTDGGGCLVMVRAERAKDFPKKPVYLLGAAAEHWHNQISCMPDLTVTAASRSGPRAFEMAGVGPDDIDLLEVYDAFTINTILFLEDLGFCPKGEGGRFVEGGRLAPGGSLPVNTNGGGLSCNHPGAYGMFTLVEATRQLQGEAGDRQIRGAKLALCQGSGGVLSSQVTNILGTEETL
jgi:acetyl-CoA acetyltransferase